MAGNFDAKTDPLAPTHPIAPKFFLVVDKKILDTGCGRGRIRLASPDRPRLGCACRAPGSNPRTFMTKLKRSAYFWALPNKKLAHANRFHQSSCPRTYTAFVSAPSMMR